MGNAKKYSMKNFIDNVIMKSDILKNAYYDMNDMNNNAQVLYRTMCELYSDEIQNGNLSWFGTDDSIKRLENNLNKDNLLVRPEKYYLALFTNSHLLAPDKGREFIEFLDSVKEAFEYRFLGGESYMNKIIKDMVDTYNTVTDTKNIDYPKYMNAISRFQYINNLYSTNLPKYNKEQKTDSNKQSEVKIDSNKLYDDIFNEYSFNTEFKGIDGYTKEDAQAEEAKEMLDEMLFDQNPKLMASGKRFYSEDAEEAIKFFLKEGMIKAVAATVGVEVERKQDNKEDKKIVTTMCNLKNLDILKKGYRKYQSLLNFTTAADDFKTDEIKDEKILKLKSPEQAKKYILNNIGKKSIVELAPAMIKYKQLEKIAIADINAKEGNNAKANKNAEAGKTKSGELNIGALQNKISKLLTDMESDNYAITSISNSSKYEKMVKCLKIITKTKDEKDLKEFFDTHLDDVIDTVKTYRNYKLKDTRNSKRGNNRLKYSSQILETLSDFKDDLGRSKEINVGNANKENQAPKLDVKTKSGQPLI